MGIALLLLIQKKKKARKNSSTMVRYYICLIRTLNKFWFGDLGILLQWWVQSLWWWRSDGLEVDDLALGIYGYIDFDLGRGVAMPERERESWVKNNERKFCYKLIGKRGFWSFNIMSLKQNSHAIHVL